MSIARAKQLRANSTSAERRLWRMLFPFRTGGYHFRKQVPIGPYFADMACHHARVVIEVDGDTHYSDAGEVQDAKRDAFLRGEGYLELRFSNADVLENGEGVYEVIARALEGRAKAPGLFPKRGRLPI
jgi:very-short-patch-repair endonuclease